MQTELNRFEASAREAIQKAKTLNELMEVQQQFFSRKGELAQLMQALGQLSSAEKPKWGQAVNAVKEDLLSAFEQKQVQFERDSMAKSLESEWLDVTAPGIKPRPGHLHPLSQVQKEVEDIFSSMGFEIKDGPEVESEFYNFESLNIPASHPARDMQDTFFIDAPAHKDFGRLVLRTHTSPVQIRTMQEEGAPLRIIVPGRVFRYEATDATHDSTFYQVEGLLIDKNISLTHLKGVLKEFLTQLFKKEVTVRFRPGYFPFVEPGLEVDFGCLLCDQKGCRACKQTGWIEFLGAGMVHPNVLKAGGIDSEEYQGWAFGFGLTRLVMMRYQIPDIRLLFGGNVDFLYQF